MSDTKGELTAGEKPSLTEYLNSRLPFKLPRLPLPQTAKNADKALARIILAAGGQAVSWMKRRERLSAARTDAEVEFIREGSKAVTERLEAGDRALAERAIEAAIRERVREQSNRERIGQFAADELDANPGTSDATTEIDDDWLSTFSDRAARVSKEEMQALWGKVLAGEVRQPGSFKLRTLHALSIVEAEEAQLFHRHTGLIVNQTVLYVGPDTSPLASFSELLELQNIGVLQGVGQMMRLDFRSAQGQPAILRLAGDFAIRISSAEPSHMRLENVCALTSFGRELLKLGQTEKVRDGVAESIAESLRQDGRSFDLVTVRATTDPTQIEVRPVKTL